MGNLRSMGRRIKRDRDKAQNRSLQVWTEAQVNELLQQAIKQERERAHFLQETMLTHTLALNGIVELINTCRVVFHLNHAGQTFAGYVKAECLHDKLSGQVSTYHHLIDDMRQYGIMTIPDDDPTKVKFDKMVEDFQKALDLVDKDRDYGSEVGRWIEKWGSEWSEDFTEKFRYLVDRGGHPIGVGDPVVDAIRRCAEPFYEQYGNQWSIIRNNLWDQLTARPQNKPMSEDENTIYKAWKLMGKESRRKQVETAFR